MTDEVELQKITNIGVWIATRTMGNFFSSYIQLLGIGHGEVKRASEIWDNDEAKRKCVTDRMRQDLRNVINNMDRSTERLYHIGWYKSRMQRTTSILETETIGLIPFSQTNNVGTLLEDTVLADMVEGIEPNMEELFTDLLKDLSTRIDFEIDLTMFRENSSEAATALSINTGDPLVIKVVDLLIYVLYPYMTPVFCKRIEALAKNYREDLIALGSRLNTLKDNPPYRSAPPYVLRCLLDVTGIFWLYEEAKNTDTQQEIRNLLISILYEIIPITMQPSLEKSELTSIGLAMDYLERIGQQTSTRIVDTKLERQRLYLSFERFSSKCKAAIPDKVPISIKELYMLTIALRYIKGLKPMMLLHDDLLVQILQDIYWLDLVDRADKNGEDIDTLPQSLEQIRRELFPAPYEITPEKMAQLYHQSGVTPLNNMIPDIDYSTRLLIEGNRSIEFDDSNLANCFWRACVIWAKLNGESGDTRWLTRWINQRIDDKLNRNAIKLITENLIYQYAVAKGTIAWNKQAMDLYIWPSILDQDGSVTERSRLEMAIEESHELNEKQRDNLSTLKSKLETELAIKDKLSIEHARLESKLHKTEDEVLLLRDQLQEAKASIETIKHAYINNSIDSNDLQDDQSEIIRFLGGGIIFGGHPNWHSKLKEYLPNFEFIDRTEHNFDPNKIKRFSNIYFYSDYITHALAYRLKANMLPHQQLVYLPQNIRKVMQMIHICETV